MFVTKKIFLKHLFSIAVYATLAVPLYSCENAYVYEYKDGVTIAQILDSVQVYLDSVPLIAKVVAGSVPEKFDTTQMVYFHEAEFRELEKQVYASLFGRYTATQKEENVLSLLYYKLYEEIKQYNHVALSKTQLRRVYDSLVNPLFWKNGEQVVESDWLNTDTLIILVGQSHSFDFTDEENKQIMKVQTDIFKLNERLIEQGIDLFLLEGFTVKEIDRRIATKARLDVMFKSIEKYYEYHTDSSYSVYTYGLESPGIHAMADSVFKLLLFTENYMRLDSANLPQSFPDFKQSFTTTIEYLLDSLSIFTRNLDTARLYDSAFTYLSAYELIQKDHVYKLWDDLSVAANKLTLNKRNEFALHTATNVMKYTNRNIAVIKIGNNHLHKRTHANVMSHFSSQLETIQYYCKNRGYSYVYLLTEEDYKKLY